MASEKKLSCKGAAGGGITGATAGATSGAGADGAAGAGVAGGTPGPASNGGGVGAAPAAPEFVSAAGAVGGGVAGAAVWIRDLMTLSDTPCLCRLMISSSLSVKTVPELVIYVRMKSSLMPPLDRFTTCCNPGERAGAV